ncbi:ABC transporter ATP-binding protein [Paenibacillus sp. YYML68]|uniref:ABC transporter ATP-binding protein n=1 Tax=Paenibacillus sp. YYML68 TaxID=2909250 RepID=UPI00249168D9|nr:ABC transporter ATP-binding protein [Paenibacillus sp. YYML68]
MSILTVKELTKAYRGRKVVNEISFALKQGEIFAFLGRNGAGKSTTIHMLTGIIPPTSGEIELFNASYKSIDKLKQRIGVLPDNSQYYNDMTALQHLQFFARVKGLKPVREELIALLDEVGLGEHYNKKAGQFSLGMKKKLGIAQALIGSPELLFLDEPTSTLDIESSIQIRSLLRKLASQGITIFMTSHNLEEVEKLCDRIAIINQGRIEKLGTLEQLQTAHTTELKVKLKYASEREDSLQQWLGQLQLHTAVAPSLTEGGWLEFTVQHEESIADIVEAASRHHVRIFRVEVEATSLEAIFIDHEQPMQTT